MKPATGWWSRRDGVVFPKKESAGTIDVYERTNLVWGSVAQIMPEQVNSDVQHLILCCEGLVG
jgi:hypothetical protein